MENTEELYLYTLNLLHENSIKHKVWRFPSGNILLDIWYDDRFFVIQFEDFIGISEVDENVGFDNVPDKKIYDSNLYKSELKNIFR